MTFFRREHATVFFATAKRLIASTFLVCDVTYAEPRYEELRRLGSDYAIAAAGLEELRQTECAYALKGERNESFAEVYFAVHERLNERDKKVAHSEFQKMRAELRPYMNEQLAALKLRVDGRTACGMVVGYALDRLVQARMNWKRSTPP